MASSLACPAAPRTVIGSKRKRAECELEAEPDGSFGWLEQLEAGDAAKEEEAVWAAVDALERDGEVMNIRTRCARAELARAVGA